GLAGVWATENSREAIFDALVRREVFGTSGTRISVRFFGGWSLPSKLCSEPNMLDTAYREGVPMGGVLPVRPGGSGPPAFLVAAMRDPSDLASPLQRIQIIKGWMANHEEAHIRVFEVAGNPENGASVDVNTCTRQGKGSSHLCAVWRDPEFDPGQ